MLVAEVAMCSPFFRFSFPLSQFFDRIQQVWQLGGAGQRARAIAAVRIPARDVQN